MNTTDMMRASSIRTAIIVDDAYDAVPRASDLRTANDEWSIFWDDLTDDDQGAIRNFFPELDGFTEEELQICDAFVAALWSQRHSVRPELVNPLFEMYIADSISDMAFVNNVEELLSGLNLKVSCVGREFEDQARLSDLIVIDLFLGATQDDPDMQLSMDGLRGIVDSRRAEPPVIILMSRSNRLAANAERFRDHARVFASGFRTINKSDVNKPTRLEQVLWELAGHRNDSLKLAHFSEAWRAGLSEAVDRASADIRRLDLEDWAQIRDLLLKDEGVSTGNYIVDVFDRVLLHEVERNVEVIDAARELDSLQSESYPPTTIVGSKDTMGLVIKTLYQNESRRKLDSTNGGPVTFGDILCLVDEIVKPKGTIFEGVSDTVYVVMTPSCDLQRQEASRTLLMAGSVNSLDAQSVKPVFGGFRTVVLELVGGRRVSVDWRPTDLVAVSNEELATLLREGSGVRVAGRLREENALSLQQKLLSHLGRVGLVSPMPFTFLVEVRVFYTDANLQLQALPIGERENVTGVCFVGRHSDNKEVRMVLDSDERFSFLDSLNALTGDLVHADSWDKVQKVVKVEVLNLLFGNGIKIDVSKPGPQSWKVHVEDLEETLGRILYNGEVPESLGNDGNRKGYGMIFEVREVPNGDQMH